MNSQDFYKLFDIKDTEHVKNYIWNSLQREIGFSITKLYPKSSFFKIAVKNNGTDDTAMLIKIYIIPKDGATELPVGISVSKISLYQLDNENRFIPGYDFNDQNSPTEESLRISSEGFQPINLEDNNRFIFKLSDNSFFDKKKKKVVFGHDIIAHIYNEHIKTISSMRGILMKVRIRLNNFQIKSLEKIGELLLKIIPSLSGRGIENKYHNILLAPFNWANPQGVQDQVNTSNLVAYDDLLKKINPFTFSIVTSIVVLLYVLYSRFCTDFLGLISFLKDNKDDQIFAVTIIAFTILFFNYMLPNFLLWLLNQSIILSRRLSSRRFEL